MGQGNQARRTVHYYYRCAGCGKEMDGYTGYVAVHDRSQKRLDRFNYCFNCFAQVHGQLQRRRNAVVPSPEETG